MVTTREKINNRLINVKQKNMKKMLLLGLLLGSISLYAQKALPKIPDSAKKVYPQTGATTITYQAAVKDSAKIALMRAKVFLNPKTKHYNPDNAFAIYQQYARKGNAQAMNGLANLYNNGLGTSVNEKEALNWYQKAAEAGYANAWFNWGSMYKAGIGTPQDFEKAYEIFSKGAALNIGLCLYAQGYMLYKGFGVAQNYQQAAMLFKKGAAVRNVASYFMLGLCYRNGYGIAQNTDSARYYLSQAAARKDSRAIKELKSLTPENSPTALVEPPQPPAKLAAPIKLKAGFKKTNQNLAKNATIGGEYEGYIIKFDWSGKHIISQSRLRLNLEQKNRQLFGQWEEEGQDPVYLNAKITDTALVFSHTQQAQTDHYHRDKKLLLQFKKGYLSVVQSADTIYLSGHIEVYSPKAKEPEKPRLMMLVRTGVATAETPAQPLTNAELAAKMAEEDQLDELALQFKAYPNPFVTNTTFKYTLRRPATVNVLITDVLTGKTVYRNQQGLQQAGQYSLPLSLYTSPGNYVVTLQYNHKLKSIMVIKN